MIGVHVSKISSVMDKKEEMEIPEAIIRDTDRYGLNACQIFTYGPRFIVKNKINYKKLCEVTDDINLCVHSAYQTTSIWKLTSENYNTPDMQKKILGFKNQLLSCVESKSWGLVLHVNKIQPSVMVKVLKLLKPIVKKTNVKLILEMIACKKDPFETYETPEKINNITSMIINEIQGDHDWWGWCIDTAHIWSCGVNISSYDNMKSYLDKLTFPEKIILFHLNGSSAVFDSGKDKHEVIFGPDDIIWKDVKPQNSGVNAIIKFSIKYDIPIILEINRGLEKDIEIGINILKSLITECNN